MSWAFYQYPNSLHRTTRGWRTGTRTRFYRCSKVSWGRILTCGSSRRSRKEKLIVSERAVLEDQLIAKISKLTIRSVVEGVVTGVVDFGAFVKFDDEMEGLVHISELAWQRIEDPRNIVK